MAYRTKNNITEFVDYVNGKDANFIWRGQSDMGLPLIPSSFRKLDKELKGTVDNKKMFLSN